MIDSVPGGPVTFVADGRQRRVSATALLWCVVTCHQWFVIRMIAIALAQ